MLAPATKSGQTAAYNALSAAQTGAGYPAGKEWDFRPWRSRLLEGAAALGGIGLYAGALASVLPTHFFVATMAVGAAFVALDMVQSAPFFVRRHLKAWESRGHLQDALLRPALRRAFNDMQAALDLKDVAFRTFDRNYADQMELAHNSFITRNFVFMRFAGIPERGPKYLASQLPWMKNFYAANSTVNHVIATQTALQNYTPREARGVIAHELSHIKAGDSRSIRAYSETFLREARGIVHWSLLPTLAVAATPVATSWAVVAWAGCFAAGFAAKAALNLSSREMERRTDRNAIYLTRDIGALEHKVRFLWGQNCQPPVWRTLLSTHPLGEDRVVNARKAFAEAAAYPPLPFDSFVYKEPTSKFARVSADWWRRGM